MRQEWTDAKRIVVKIGSSLLVDAASGTLKERGSARLPTTSRRSAKMAGT